MNSILQTFIQMSTPQPIKKINQEEFQKWQHSVLFDIIKNVGYGRSFCNHFDIKDFILLHTDNQQDADRYIRRVYL